MEESVVTNFVAIVIFLPQQFHILLGHNTNHKETAGDLFFFQDIEHLWCIHRIGAIIECECNFFIGFTESFNYVLLG
ncbi:hypothetical protein D3C85_1248090 [compost metagenome]